MSILRTSSALSAQIKLAFATSSRPTRQALVTGDSLEASMIRNYLAPRTWQELDSDALQNYDSRADLSALPAFLSDAGFRYYLPALMLFIVSAGEAAGLLGDSVISTLTRCRVEDFDQTQRAAVTAFLSFLANENSRDEPMQRELQKALRWWSATAT